jgi:hypothetical protein
MPIMRTNNPTPLDCLLWVREALMYMISKKIPIKHVESCENALYWVTVAIGELDEVRPNVQFSDEEGPFEPEELLMTCLDMPREVVHLWAPIGRKKPHNRSAQLAYIRVLRDMLRWVLKRKPRNHAAKEALNSLYPIIGTMLVTPEVEVPDWLRVEEQ